MHPIKVKSGLRAQLEQFSTGDLIRLWVHITGHVPELEPVQALRQFAAKLESHNHRKVPIEGLLLTTIDRRLEQEAREKGRGGRTMHRPRGMR